MEGKEKKGGTFQFECPRCKSLLEIPFSKKRFKCPICGASYGLNIQVEQEDEGRADWKKRTMKEELQIYSKFEKAMHLEGGDEDTSCDRHEYSDESCTKKFDIICLLCRKRLCGPCGERIHMHPEFKNHVALTRSIFDQSKKMYTEVVKTKGVEGKIPCHILATQIKKYFKSKPIRKLCEMLMYKDVDKYGKNYMISFEQFVTEVGQFIAHEGNRRAHPHKDDQLSAKQKTEAILHVETEAWHDLGCCGRSIYDCQRRLENFRGHKEFALWLNHLREVQASFGSSVVSVFYFSRWMFVLNTLLFILFLGFIIIPGFSDMQNPNDYNYWGLVIGHGMENSWMFYGSYLPLYFNSRYDMGAAWVLVCSLMLFLSLIATIVHMDAGHSNQKEDHTFAFSNLVFGGYDYQLRYRHPIELQRKFIHTSIEHQLIERGLQESRQKKEMHKILNANKALIGRLLTLAFMAFNMWFIYFLVVYENETILPSWKSDGKYLFIPILIAASKLVSPWAIGKLLRFEHFTRIGPELRQYFSRLLFLRVAYVVFIVFAVASSKNIYTFSDNCPETQIGVMFYRVLFADYMLEFVIATIYPFFRIALIRKLYQRARPLAPEHRTPLVSGDNDLNLLSSSGRRRLTSPRNSEPISEPGSPKSPKSEEASPGLQLPSVAENGGDDVQLGVPPAPSPRARKGLHERMISAVPVPERSDTSFNLEQKYNDKFKEEFDIPTCIVDIMYRQTLIWCGTPFCPMLTFLGMFFSWLFFFVKKYELMQYARRPKTPMGVARQNRFFRTSMITTMILSIIPFTFFLRRSPECGPHRDVTGGTTIVDSFLQDLDRLPAGVSIVLNYFTSVVLLWMLLIIGLIYMLTLRRRGSYLRKELKKTQLRLSLETAERKKIIEVYDVRIGLNEARGQELFKQWVDDMGEIGERYGPRLTGYGYGDLIKLCKLTDDQLSGILTKVGCTPGHASTIKRHLVDKRQELVYLTVNS